MQQILTTFLAITELNGLLRGCGDEELIRIELPLLITGDVYYNFLVITGKLYKYLQLVGGNKNKIL